MTQPLFLRKVSQLSEPLTKEISLEQKTQNKTGLVFIQMYKAIKTRDKKNVLIFIDQKTCVSIPRKYLEKVLSDEQSENTQQEKSS